MNLDKVPLSDNVEINCLGKQVGIHSPEAGAAMACQNEVNQYRAQSQAKAVDHYVKKYNEVPTEGQVEKLKDLGDDQLNKTVKDFVDQKSSIWNSMKGFFSNAKDGDTFQSRQIEFGKFFEDANKS